MKEGRNTTPPAIDALVQSFFSKYHAEAELVHKLFIESTLQWLTALWQEDGDKLDCLTKFLLSITQFAPSLPPEEFILFTLLSKVKVAPVDAKKLTEELEKHSPAITQWTLVHQRVMNSPGAAALIRLRPLIQSYLDEYCLTPFAFFTNPIFDKAYDIISLVRIILGQLDFPEDAVVVFSKNLPAIQEELKNWLIDIKQSRSEEKSFRYNEDDVRLDNVMYLPEDWKKHELSNLLTLPPHGEEKCVFAFAWREIPLDGEELMKWSTVKTEGNSPQRFFLERAKRKYLTRQLRKYFEEKSKAWSWQTMEVEETKRSTYRMDSIVLAYADFMKENSEIFVKHPIISESWSIPIINYLNRVEEIFQYSFFPEEKNKSAYIVQIFDKVATDETFLNYFFSISILKNIFECFYKALCQSVPKHIHLIEKCHEDSVSLFQRVDSRREEQLQLCQHVVLLINDSEVARSPDGAITVRKQLLDLHHLETLIIRKKILTKVTYSVGFILARPILKISHAPTELALSRVYKGECILLWKESDGNYRMTCQCKHQKSQGINSFLFSQQGFDAETLRKLDELPVGVIPFENNFRGQIYRYCDQYSGEVGLYNPSLKYIERRIEDEALLKLLGESKATEGFVIDSPIREQVFRVCSQITLSIISKKSSGLSSWLPTSVFGSGSDPSSSYLIY